MKKVLHDFGTERGIDGMCVDVRGNLYGAAGSGRRGGVAGQAPKRLCRNRLIANWAGAPR